MHVDHGGQRVLLYDVFDGSHSVHEEEEEEGAAVAAASTSAPAAKRCEKRVIVG